ncbi:hypothetical protein BHF68_10720 [Desulfuribacillus alkaliarsenatis]|uniref:Uncharacterized protein n=1 Tax=Desulfuribacillus alkaliarsenatis TaxID=766136 RepID=A0A1E5FZ60_9FIRM|nr:hypothetical protein BHF68_10720 [Desulfuribacillus alkaliarsenatis]
MIILPYLFVSIAIICLYFAIRKQKPLLLTVPFFTMFVYVIAQIAMVPLGFFETIQLILSLK